MSDSIGHDDAAGVFRVDLRTKDLRRKSINAMVQDSAGHHADVVGAIGCAMTGMARQMIIECVRAQHSMSDEEAELMGNALADIVLHDGAVNMNVAQMIGDLAYLFEQACETGMVPAEVAFAYAAGRHTH